MKTIAICSALKDFQLKTIALFILLATPAIALPVLATSVDQVGELFRELLNGYEWTSYFLYIPIVWYLVFFVISGATQIISRDYPEGNAERITQTELTAKEAQYAHWAGCFAVLAAISPVFLLLLIPESINKPERALLEELSKPLVLLPIISIIISVASGFFIHKIKQSIRILAMASGPLAIAIFLAAFVFNNKSSDAKLSIIGCLLFSAISLYISFGMRFRRHIIQTWVVSLVVSTIFLSFVWNAPLEAGRIFPTAILSSLCLASWSILLSGFIFLLRQTYKAGCFKKICVVAIVFLGLYLAGHTNSEDDYIIRPFASKDNTLDSELTSWVANQKNTDNIPRDLYIVIAEGGGIRAAIWTVQILGLIRDHLPDLSDKIFAISGVSGGSLGALAFNSFRYSEVVNDASSAGNAIDTIKYNTIFSHLRDRVATDHLSGLAAKMFSFEPLTLLFPRLFETNRNSALRNSWLNSLSCPNNRSENKWNCSDVSAYANTDVWENVRKKDTGYKIPLLFLNASDIKTGQRVIFSSIYTDDTVFPKSFVGRLSHAGHSSPLDGAILSASFPIVSPPTTVLLDNNLTLEVVDGGIVDGSGALTGIDLVNSIAKISKDKGFNIRLNILVLDNDPNEPRGHNVSKRNIDFAPARYLPSILSPVVQGSYSAQANRGFHLKRALRSITCKLGGSYRTLEVQPGDERLALGWSLSRGADTWLFSQSSDAFRKILSKDTDECLSN